MVYIKVYIIGDRRREKEFEEAEQFLKKCGHVPVNPLKVLHSLPEEINNSDFTLIAFELIRVCDAVYLLSGWSDDLFARMERTQSIRVEKKVLN